MTDAPDAVALREAIEQRYGTVHKFCRRHKDRLNRATVYMILAGKYPGNVATQTRRILEALGLARGREDELHEAIKGVACARCSVQRRPCDRCDALFRAQAAAAMRVLISAD